MENQKPILATNIDGFLLKHEAFIEPHRKWFDKAAMLLKDESVKKWKGTPNYFKGVNEVMERIMPSATKEERTAQARKWYQQEIVGYIRENPGVVCDSVVNKLIELKSKYTLALVTTNTQQYINKILKAADLEGIYDIVFASQEKEEPIKKEVFRRFVDKYRKPEYYIAAKNGERFESCLKLGITTIYAGWDIKDDYLEKKAAIKLEKPSKLETL